MLKSVLLDRFGDTTEKIKNPKELGTIGFPFFHTNSKYSSVSPKFVRPHGVCTGHHKALQIQLNYFQLPTMFWGTSCFSWRSARAHKSLLQPLSQCTFAVTSTLDPGPSQTRYWLYVIWRSSLKREVLHVLVLDHSPSMFEGYAILSTFLPIPILILLSNFPKIWDIPDIPSR